MRAGDCGARAFFVRAKKTGPGQDWRRRPSAALAGPFQFSCVFVGSSSTAADWSESIIADRRTALPLSQPRLFVCRSRAANCIVAISRQPAALPLTPAGVGPGVSRPSQASACVPHFVHRPLHSSPPHPPASAPSPSCARNCSCTARACRHCCPRPNAASARPHLGAHSCPPCEAPWICLPRRFRSRARRDTPPSPPVAPE